MAAVSNPAYSSATFSITDSTICSGPATSYTYDGLNRQFTSTAPGGSVTTHMYAADATSHSDQTLEIDPALHNRLQYADGLGRLKEVDENAISWQGGTYGFSGQSTYTTTYGYDEQDDLTSVSQSGQSRSFTYDSLKRLVQAMNPESGTIKYSYDLSGNVFTRTDANGSILSSAYDGLNRITSKSYTLGANVAKTSSVNYGYGDGTQPSKSCTVNLTAPNLKGRLTCVATGTLLNNYTNYDWAGRVKAYSQITNNITYPMLYAYDLAGELTSFTFPSLRVQTNRTTGGRERL